MGIYNLIVTYKGKYIEQVSDEIIGIIRVIPEDEFYLEGADICYTIFSFETEDEAFRKELILLKNNNKNIFESRVLTDEELYEEGKAQGTNDALNSIELNGMKSHD